MRIALLDSDIIAYAVAANSQQDFGFSAAGGTDARVVDKKQCWKLCDEVVQRNADAVKADSVVICLSDPKVNFRKELEPTYKENRKNTVKPELLMLAKEYLFEEYRSFIRPRLEADDVMGILATRPTLLGKGVDDVVIVSEDKDMRTIPARVYNPNHADVGIMDITPTEANQFLMWQTICGDPTDGYPGCPRVGAKSVYAEDALEITDPLEMWDNVLMAYGSRGLTEEDAVHQARLARILRAEDYNFKRKTIRLWNPTKLFW